MSKPLSFRLTDQPAPPTGETAAAEDSSVRQRVLAALDDPRPALTTQDVRQAMERHHAKTLKAHGES